MPHIPQVCVQADLTLFQYASAELFEVVSESVNLLAKGHQVLKWACKFYL